MVLRNAFEDLATDESVQEIIGLLLPRLMANTKTFAREVSGPDVLEPLPGGRLRVVWVAFAPQPDAELLAPFTVQFAGAAEPLYLNYALAHWQVFEGDVDQALEFIPGNTVPVAVTVHYQDF